jgi:hypothetical protein
MRYLNGRAGFVRRDANGPLNVRAAAERKVDVRGSMKWLLFGALCLAVTGFARPAAAQDEPAKVEVSGGWNYLAMKSNADEQWFHFGKGWYADVAGNLNSRWAVVGQVSGAYKSIIEDLDELDVKVHPYLGGIRFSSRRDPKVTPFAQFLLGMSNFKVSGGGESLSHNFFTYQAGGGVNIRAGERLAARVSADYFRIIGDEDSGITDEAFQGLRLAVGVIFPIGSR